MGFTFLHTLTLGNNRIGNLQVSGAHECYSPLRVELLPMFSLMPRECPLLCRDALPQFLPIISCTASQVALHSPFLVHNMTMKCTEGIPFCL